VLHAAIAESGHTVVLDERGPWAMNGCNLWCFVQNPPYMIFSCTFVLIGIPAKLREFHDVFNNFHTAVEQTAKKKMVESLVAELVAGKR